jgi:protein TonB
VFTRLPESNARRQRRAGGLVVSTAIHLVIIALAVRATGLTAAPPPRVDPVVDLYLPSTPTPSVPAPRPIRRLDRDPSLPPTPNERSVLAMVTADIPSVIPEAGSMNPLMEPSFDPTRVAGGAAPGGPPNVSDGSPLLENQVEQAVIAIPGTSTPRYPAMLQSAGLEGDVRARFVVDTLGRVEQGSVRTLESTHDLFAAAVRDALTRARFKPAEVGGRKVRQLVEQTFTFRIAR